MCSQHLLGENLHHRNGKARFWRFSLMQIQLRRAHSVLAGFSLLLLSVFISPPSFAAEKTRIRVDDYKIEAELTPHLHQISARAKVKFTALEDINAAIFELHNGLRVTKVSRRDNHPLSAERVTQDYTVRVYLPEDLPKDASSTLPSNTKANSNTPTIALSPA